MREVHESAKRGIRLLLARQLFTQLLAFAASVVLARRLDPADFGLFGISVFFVNALATLGDLGLKAALIQRAGEFIRRRPPSWYGWCGCWRSRCCSSPGG